MAEVAEALAARVQQTEQFKQTQAKGLPVPKALKADDILEDAREQLLLDKSKTSRLLAHGQKMSALRVMMEDVVSQELEDALTAGADGQAWGQDDGDAGQGSSNDDPAGATLAARPLGAPGSQAQSAPLYGKASRRVQLPDDACFSEPSNVQEAGQPSPFLLKRTGSHSSKKFGFLDVGRAIFRGGDDSDFISEPRDADAEKAQDSTSFEATDFSFLTSREPSRAGKELDRLRAVQSRSKSVLISAQHAAPTRSATISDLAPAASALTLPPALSDGTSLLQHAASMHSTASLLRHQRSSVASSELSVHDVPQGGPEGSAIPGLPASLQPANGTLLAKPLLPRLQLAQLQDPPVMSVGSPKASSQSPQNSMWGAREGALSSRCGLSSPCSSRVGPGTPNSVKAFNAKGSENEFPGAPQSSAPSRSKSGLPMASAIHIAPRSYRSSVVAPALLCPESPQSTASHSVVASPQSPLSSPGPGTSLTTKSSPASSALPPLSIGPSSPSGAKAMPNSPFSGGQRAGALPAMVSARLTAKQAGSQAQGAGLFKKLKSMFKG